MIHSTWLVVFRCRSTRHILSLPTFTSHHISSAECGIASNRTYIRISVTLHFQIWLGKRNKSGSETASNMEGTGKVAAQGARIVHSICICA